MSDDPDIDLVTLEVVRAHLIATVREMGKAMIRTAHSSIIYEGHDFSCAILGADGELVAQSEGSPAHIIPLPWQVREALAHYGGRLDDGDVVMVNDPYSSGTHMNDVALIAPFFAAGRRLAIIVVRAHWGDVGGMTAGSISGRATEVFQEGLRIPFTKVYRQGQPVPEILDLVLANVRVPEERDGDFHAMLACCHTARGRLAELAGRFGAERLEAIMSALLDRAERRMRLAIARIRDGTYLYEDYLDSDNVSGRPVLLRVAATVTGEAFHADFAGSAAQVKGPVNCSLAVTAMGTFVALKALLDPKGVINGGGFRPVTVEAPEGTIVNCRHPAATGGFSELRRRVETVVMGALSRAAPDYVAGDVKGATNHTYIASVHPGRGRTTIFYEYPSGGTGGFLEHDGSDTVRAYDEGDFSSIQPAEAVEMEHALLVERTELRTDSCGDGRHRGGLGLRREVRLLAETGSFSELSDRNLIPPYGVSGGHASSPNRFTVLRDGATLQPSDVPGKVSDFPLRQGDVVVMETAGGGGYGRAVERDVGLVAGDVREGYLSEARARERYGVVFRRGRIDETATAARRRRLASGVKTFRVVAAGEDDFEDGRRLCRLARADARTLRARDGSLVEYVGAEGAPLRAWTRISADVSRGTLPLGPVGRGCLGLGGGDTVEVRVLDGRPPRRQR